MSFRSIYFYINSYNFTVFNSLNLLGWLSGIYDISIYDKLFYVIYRSQIIQPTSANCLQYNLYWRRLLYQILITPFWCYQPLSVKDKYYALQIPFVHRTPNQITHTGIRQYELAQYPYCQLCRLRRYNARTRVL